MGMDVYGKNPISDTGRYFRANVWSWRPLAAVVCHLCPDEAAGCQHWHTNDGDGLDRNGAARLAHALDERVADGSVDKWLEQRREFVASLPRQTCEFCGGTGVRNDDVGAKAKMPERVCGDTLHPFTEEPHPRAGEKGWCNACHGVGTVEHFESRYHTDREEIEQFAAFLRDSGGFEIW